MTNTKGMDTTKQTAVDLMFQKAMLVLPMGSIDARQALKETYEEAKEMEKEQIKSAFNIGELMAHDYFYGNDECAENYYKETYGGGNK
jgi:glycogen synthase